MRRFPEEGSGIPVIEPFLWLTRVNNTGAAFGLFRDRTPLLALVSAAGILFFLFYWIKKKRQGAPRSVETASALVIAGTAGNLYDRAVYGYVLDYIDLRVWPVFNVADIAIVSGIGVLALTLLVRHEGK